MATINASNLSLLDLTSRMDPQGNVSPIVEALSKNNVVLQDAVFKEGNLPTGHLITSRTALPSVGWRRFNEGVPTSKSRTGQVQETAGILEGASQVDKDLAKLNGNEAAFRMSEDMAFIEALNIEAETSFFYHSTKTDPEKVMGMAPRLDSLSGPYANQIITPPYTLAGGDASSIWLVGWGDRTVYGFTPKGMPGGLERTDLGLQWVTDSGGTNKYMAYVTNWSWKFGWAVEDARYLVRCQVDYSAMSATDGAIITAMIKMVNQLYNFNCRPVFYCGRAVNTYLDLQARADVKGGGGLTWESVGGRPVMMFRGIPVRRSDSLHIAESAIT